MEEDNYDLIRQKNIAERNAKFAEFFKDLKSQTTELKEIERQQETIDDDIENQPPRKRRRLSSQRKRRQKEEFSKKYFTRSQKRGINSSDESNECSDWYKEMPEPKTKPKIQVLFPWAKTMQRSIDLMRMGICDVDEEEENEESFTSYFVKKKIRVTKSEYDSENIPSVDEIDEEMLQNVAERSSEKVYCKVNGTSCHQCRQKTLDTKTVCRSGECVGVRGQFCGPCLKGRYGESAVDALKDANWACPPCRGLCNCSICRTRNGLAPTGILAPTAQEEGYSCVMDYLQSAEIDDA